MRRAIEASVGEMSKRRAFCSQDSLLVELFLRLLEVRVGVCEKKRRRWDLPDDLDVAEEFVELWVA